MSTDCDCSPDDIDCVDVLDGNPLYGECTNVKWLEGPNDPNKDNYSENYKVCDDDKVTPCVFDAECTGTCVHYGPEYNNVCDGCGGSSSSSEITENYEHITTGNLIGFEEYLDMFKALPVYVQGLFTSEGIWL